MKFFSALSVAGSIALIVPAGAATIIYSGATVTMGGASGTTTATGSLPYFNPAFGTLTGVLFQVSDSTFATLRYENLTAAPPASAGSSEAIVTILLDGATTLASATSSASHTGGAISGFDGVIDFAGTSGFTAAPVTFMGSGMGGGTPALYQGSGSFPVTIERNASQEALSAPGGFVITNNSASTRVDYQVTYTFTPIPEPASTSFVGLAAAALLWRRRRN